MRQLAQVPQLAIAMLVTALCVLTITPERGFAQATTGSITGVVTDASGKPVADVRVTAASASQTANTTSNAAGFFSLVNLTPETYTVSFEKTGYQPVSVPGVTVLQQQTVSLNQQLQVALRTIASLTATGANNLVKPNQGSDVYNVTGQELTAATNPLNLHETVYDYFAVTPGVMSNGFPGQPRVRGGQVTDLGYEFEGIPIQDRMTGFFSTNLSNIGIQNVEVYTGGLDAANSGNGTGYFNTVLKTGTYPGFTTVAYQASTPESNIFAHFERGYSTPDHRFSYYVGFNGVNSTNQYSYGQNSYPAVALFAFDGPGYVKTRDWVGNFHYRPNSKDDVQLVYTNSLGDFDFNYMVAKKPGEPPLLQLAPCPGAVAGGDSLTGATGGTAPNGQPCTDTGLFWAPANLKTGGNIWHHYGALGKIQWNHNLSDHAAFSLNLWNNFNQYIFDQPLADPNEPAIEAIGQPYNWFGSACPDYPYAVGTPLPSTHDGYDICAFFDGVQTFYGDRRSNMWGGNLDFQDAVSDRLTIKAGLRHELDHNIFEYRNINGYTVPPSGQLLWPAYFASSSYPTTRDEAYLEGNVRIGKFLLDPGLAYIQEHYAYPADAGYATGGGLCPTGLTCNVTSGGQTEHIINPTFNGTYTFGPNDVVRFSYGNTASMIGSEFIYNNSISQFTPSGVISSLKNPFLPGSSFQPQINHSADLMWEHNFGNNTTIRVGPYYNKTSNYYASYNPFLGYFAAGCDPTNISGCTPCTPGTAGCLPFSARYSVLTNNNEHQSMGVELGFNHVDNSPQGFSYWLSATYDNFWTSSFDISGSFINAPLPTSLLNAGVRVRAPSNPLWTAMITADYHSDRFHFDPQLYYQGDTFFNNGDIVTCSNPTLSSSHTSGPIACIPANGGTIVPPYFASTELIAHGWFFANLDMYEELGVKRNYVVGLKVNNLFDQETPTQPCPSDGTGCFPFNGPFSGVVDTPSSNPHPDSGAFGNNNWIYQNLAQNARTFYFYFGVRL